VARFLANLQCCLILGGVVIALGVLLILLAVHHEFLASLLAPNPFSDFRPYVVFAVSVVAVVVLGRRGRRAWDAEREQLSQVLLRSLGLPPGEEGLVAARERILALVPCRGRRLAGALARFATGRRLWLCFLADQLLVLSGFDAGAVALPTAQLQKLYLVERRRGGRYVLALDAGGISVLVVSRLADLVRVVNVLKKQGIALGYRKHA
jgi:hypothetical protein